MAMYNGSPVLTSTPRLEFGRVTVANTGRDGSGTITTVITGVAAGTRISRVVTQAEGTTAAGMLRLWLTIDNAVTWKL